MFASVGRRLALLNAVVVAAVIALAGLTTFVLLRQSLDREADSALAERAAAARDAWEDLFVSDQPLRQDTSPSQTSDDRHGDVDEDDGDRRGEDDDGDDHHDKDEERELVESGDTLLFAVDTEGRQLANARGLPIPGLPDPNGVAVALTGVVDARTVNLGNETVRVYTAPVRGEAGVIGAVQAARSDREHQAELRLVGILSLVGLGLGGIIAVPAGLFLARRAMQPIGLAVARQRAFVADASHELRTPLTLIRATTEYAQRLPDASSAVREELGGVVEEIDATSHLVDDLLLLARLDSAELPLQREHGDLGAIAGAAATSLTPLAEAAGLSLAVEASSELPVYADAGRIRQVVRILLDNAIAYTPAGGSVRVGVERHGGRGRVTVRDTGPGIAAAEHARVFERFYRADRARSRKTGGTGLGLAIARALVLAHGGEIGLQSQPGHGTTVWFNLPLSESRSGREGEP
jgi:signal transduction histidine kinase